MPSPIGYSGISVMANSPIEGGWSQEVLGHENDAIVIVPAKGITARYDLPASRSEGGMEPVEDVPTYLRVLSCSLLMLLGRLTKSDASANRRHLIEVS